MSVGSEPTLETVLRDLRQATVLTFTLADYLQNHQPDFGKVHLRDVPAWVVMGLVTENQMQDGRWEKTDTGYRLEGKSLAMTLPVDTPTRAFLWWIGAGLVALGLLVAARWYLRYKGKPAH